MKDWGPKQLAIAHCFPSCTSQEADWKGDSWEANQCSHELLASQVNPLHHRPAHSFCHSRPSKLPSARAQLARGQDSSQALQFGMYHLNQNPKDEAKRPPRYLDVSTVPLPEFHGALLWPAWWKTSFQVCRPSPWGLLRCPQGDPGRLGCWEVGCPDRG